jgi:hypothetical protein
MASGDPGSRGAGGRHRGRRLVTETKASYKTSELIIWALVTIGILIAGNTIEAEEGGPDIFGADKVWLYITILSSAYLISRGLAKSGTREPYDEEGDR